MQNNFLQWTTIIVIVLIIMACARSIDLNPKKNLIFDVPEGWPQPVYNFSKNPLTASKIALGRMIFYDPILSRDSTISCASCHLSYTAFTHTDHDLSHGIEDRIGTRNSLTLTNLAWSPSFMWDGAVNHLDMQSLAPISHSTEMDFDIELVVNRLNSNFKYQTAFTEAWGSELITGERFLKSISQFVLTLVTSNSKYDRIMRSEAGVEFTEKEQKGYEQFKAKCASCHVEPLFTDYSYQNNGLTVDSTLNDSGRMLVTKNSIDSLKFKVPSLRNIEFSYPYMHDGRFRRLKFVMKHYSNGLVEHDNLAEQLRGKINLSSDERVELIAFLKTLTDKEFLFNKSFTYPKP